MRFLCFLSFSLSFLLALGAVEARAGGTMTDLGTVLVGTNSDPHSTAAGINDKGQILIGSFNRNLFDSHAYLYDLTTDTLTDLATHLGHAFLGNSGINNLGQVIGWRSSFLYDSVSDTWTDLSASPGSASLFYLIALNDLGQVVGNGVVPNASGFDEGHTLIWKPDLAGGGKWSDLGTIVQSTATEYASSQPYAINNTGQVVGDFFKASTLTGEYQGPQHAFLYDPDPAGGGTWTDIGALVAAASSSRAVGINDYGQIVGAYRGASWNSPVHAFIYNSVTGKLSDFRTLFPDEFYSAAYAINNRGQILGSSTSLSTGSYIQHVFLYDPVKGISLIEPLPGFELVWPSGLNNHGQVVGSCSVSLSTGYVIHAFLWTPDANPTPTIDSVAFAAATGWTLSGTAAAGATIWIYAADGTTVIGTATADATGAWTSTLSGGDYPSGLTVTATDGSGNVSPPVSPPATSPATAPIITAVAFHATTGMTSVSGTDTIGDVIRLYDAYGNLIGTFAVAAGTTVNLYNANGIVVGTVTVNADGSWTLTLSGDLRSGLALIATNATGNVSAPVSPPAAPIVDASTFDPAAGNGGKTTLTGLAAPGSTLRICDASGNLLGEVTVASGATSNIYAADGTTVIGTVTVTVGTAGSWILTLRGDHRGDVTVTAADAAGNASAPANLPPLADAGADQVVEATGADGAAVTLDGSRSTDPEGRPLSLTWTGPFPQGGGTVTGVAPDVTLALGTHWITLSADDGEGGTSTDDVEVQVVDTTPPVVTAALVSVGEGDDHGDHDDGSDGDGDHHGDHDHDRDRDRDHDGHRDHHGDRDRHQDRHEGRFQVVFTASDLVDPAPTVEAVLLVPGLAPIHLTQGQVIELELDDASEPPEMEWEHEKLEIEGASMVLRVTATDASGNPGVADAHPTGLSADNDYGDDHGDDHDD